MKIFPQLLILLLLSACSSAQNFKLIEAIHTTKIGGVKGSRTESFDLVIKNNSKLEAKYLLLGEVKVPLNKEVKNEITHYHGIYFPENTDEATLDYPTPILKFDPTNAYLISENVGSKNLIKQKVNFKKHIDSLKKNEDMPQ